MADPLRRTLCRLREKRGPRGVGGLGLQAATVAASCAEAEGNPWAARCPPEDGAHPSAEQPPWSPGTRDPGGRSEPRGALGPRPRGAREAASPDPRLAGAPGHAAVGSEGSAEDDEDGDADYYENLPGGSGPAPEGAEAQRRASPAPAAGSSPGAEGGRLETGRLQTQLREAYYLLIQAMHDLPPDAGTRRAGGGSADRGCPAGARAPGQPPSTDGRAGCPRGWERSGRDRPPQQVSPPRSPPRESGGGRLLTPRTRLACSRSLENLRVGAKPPAVQRWPSDSWIGCGAHGDRDEPPPRGGGMDGWSPGSHRTEAAAGFLPPGCQDYGGCSGSAFGDPAGTSVMRSGKGDHQEGPPFLRPPAVTVKKLQKWMYKGRLLSLGMKGRAGGTAPKVPGAQATSPDPSAWKVRENHVVSVLPDQRIALTDLFENIAGSSEKRRERGELRGDAELRGRKPLTSITVSKKRNWLYQSPLRAQGEHTLCQDRSYFSTSPVSPPGHQLSPPLFKSPEPHRTLAVCNGRHCPADFNEENDADDEGEIWYNPIPEDDDLGGCSPSGLEEGNPAALGGHLLCAGGRVKAEPQDVLCPALHAGDARPTQCGGASAADSMQPADALRPCKQRLRPRTPEGVTVEDGPRLKSPLAGPGVSTAPSRSELGSGEPSCPSPSPMKRGPANWSLPDKIKSPRTVRKLSMRMKRLPEFGRMLSARGAAPCLHSTHQAPALPGCSCPQVPHTVILPSPTPTAAAKRNVISRYHLDTTVSAQHSCRRTASVGTEYSCRGGYLSDGDSPAPAPKSGRRGSESRCARGRDPLPSGGGKTELDTDAFRHYSFADQPKCSQYLSGLMSVHLYGAEDLKPPRIDSKDVFCAIQVDSVNKARTALLTCRTTFLDMDHTFNIEIENAQHLKLVVFSWEPTPRRNRVCCHGTVVLPTLFRVTRTHQLAVKLEPRGLIYVKATLMEQWENSLPSLERGREPVVFGVDIQKVVEKENVGLMVPLLIHRCIVEIERRGCQVVGLYRLCGSAAVKKELREAFEKDSKTVGLCENQYPDINVITGVLKDYLRELPSPLITKQLYDAVLEAMVKSPLKMSSSGCENEAGDSRHTVDLLNCLPAVERATLKMLLDHLKLVASYHAVNKMTCQNLAVCFGPVLLSQRQETAPHSNRVFTDSEELASALDFKKHIEVLHYLLQLWPVRRLTVQESTDSLFPEQSSSPSYLRRKKGRPCVLDLSGSDASGLLRPRQLRLDSPVSNRYAGDWSSCGDNYFLNTKENLKDVDYDNVPSEDGEDGDDSKMEGPELATQPPAPIPKECPFQTYLAVQTIESPVDRRAHLRDLQASIDTLIGNLERELNKNKLPMSV